LHINKQNNTIMSEQRGWKTATANERTRAAKERDHKGLDYINSDLEQFVPLDGDNCIRIVPPLAEDTMANLWGVDAWTYYLTGKNFLSPTLFSKKARNPAAEAYRKVKAEDPEEAKRLQLGGSKRTILFILDLNSGEKVPPLKIWAAPPSLIDEFIRVSKNRRTGQLIALEDPEEGKLIFFTRTGTGKTTDYNGVQLDSEPYPLDASLLEIMPLFSEILVEPDQEEMEAALEEVLAGIGGDDGDDKKVRRRATDDDDRPRGGKRQADDDDKPRYAKKRPVDDDDDDKPRGGKRQADDDDKPRYAKKRPVDDEDDDKPRGGKRQADDDDDDKPRGTKRQADDDDKPRGTKRQVDDDDKSGSEGEYEVTDTKMHTDATPAGTPSKLDALRARLEEKKRSGK
jgi:hypothetical protein